MVLIELGGMCAAGRLFYRIKSCFNYEGWHIDSVCMLHVSVLVYLVCVYMYICMCVFLHVLIDVCTWMCVCVCVCYSTSHFSRVYSCHE